MPVPLSAMLKATPFHAPTELALAGPGSVGEKVKDIWQDCPGSRVMPWQFWTPLKGAPGAPPTPDIATGAVPVFVIVTACGGEVVPTSTSPNSSAVGVTRNVRGPATGAAERDVEGDAVPGANRAGAGRALFGR
jgi:hypothetical protein